MKAVLFNTEMVRAILDGRKTVTRRVVKKRYSNTGLEMFTNKYGTRIIERQNDAKKPEQLVDTAGVAKTKHYLEACAECKPPYKPGDILYVRETWSTQYDGIHDDNGYGIYAYKADSTMLDNAEGMGFSRWHPSIHMPKEAARIFLRVTNVRVERLQEITEDGMQREGVTTRSLEGGLEKFIAQKAFGLLWDGTIKPPDLALYGWEANPWVWVIEFERCEQPEEGQE